MSELLIGLMSGTSMDAVDAALVQFTGDKPTCLATHHQPLPSDLRTALLSLCQPGFDELDRAARLDSSLARLFAEAVNKLLKKSGVSANQVHALGSHGQTIRHMPEGSDPFTIQISNPNLIAELTGITTVADFRRRDMAAGGQGAPLAPAFHAAFFRHPHEHRSIVNLGGMANITILPRDPKQPVTGFDTGPGNALLDAWAQKHLGVPMDRDGVWGSQGQIVTDLLACCLADPYFYLSPPKSTGREYFNWGWLENCLVTQKKPAAPADVQATLIELTARSVAEAIKNVAQKTQRVMVCGGGVHNKALMTNLRRQLPKTPVESTAVHSVDPDYVEAVGFAWLAKRTLDNQPGNLPEVTGARGLRILGGIYRA
jgi:anhydro-N-acetylmuramic acid kinase